MKKTDERKRELAALFRERAPIARTFGMTLHFEDDCAVVVLPYNPGLDHAADGIHGGVYMTLLDTAAWFTAAASRGESSWLATSEMSVHFLKPSARTDLRCVGRMLKPGKRQDIVEARLLTGHQDLAAAAREVASWGCPEVVITEAGGVLVERLRASADDAGGPAVSCSDRPSKPETRNRLQP